VTESPHLFCFGLGYSAAALAQRLLAEGWRVTGTCRDQARAEELQRLGVAPVLFDRTQPNRRSRAPARFGHPSAELGSARRNRRSGARHPWDGDHGGITAAGLDRLSLDHRRLRRSRWRLGGRGQRVDAQRPARHRRLAAERAGLRCRKRRISSASPASTGRDAPRSTRSGAARPSASSNRGRSSAASIWTTSSAVLLASIARPDPGAAYNVCDDDAADPAEVIAFACGLLAWCRHPQCPSPKPNSRPWRAASTTTTNACRNDRIKRVLGVALRYPSYREGLRALLAAGS